MSNLEFIRITRANFHERLPILPLWTLDSTLHRPPISRLKRGTKEGNPRRQRGKPEEKKTFVTGFHECRHSFFRNPSQLHENSMEEPDNYHRILLVPSHNFQDTKTFSKKQLNVASSFVPGHCYGSSQRISGTANPESFSQRKYHGRKQDY